MRDNRAVLEQNFTFDISMLSPLTGEPINKPIKDPESFGRRVRLLSEYLNVPEELIIEELGQKGFVRARNHLYKLIKNKKEKVNEIR